MGAFDCFKKTGAVSALFAVMMGLSSSPVSADNSLQKQCGNLALKSCPEPLDVTLPNPKDMLKWDQATRVVGFRNTYRLYEGDVFSPLGSKPSELSQADRKLSQLTYPLGDKTYSINDYLTHQKATGLLILKDGKIAFEYYGAGNTPSTLWTSRSVAKSVVSVLVGVAIKEGKISSINEPITQYIPELKGTAWEGSSLRQILQHTSGVVWNEDYADPKSDFSRMTQCEAIPDPYTCVLDLVKSVKRKEGVKPGQVWSYNTGGAWLVGLALERATGMTIAKYLESRVWSRYGMEHDGVWHALVEGKVDMGGHGFNATLRDWGRFGQFVLTNGVLPSGEKILPDDWVEESTNWTKAKGSVTDYAPQGQFGYQWWYNSAASATDAIDPTFWAFGIFGQSIAINQAENLVVVQWSTWEKAESPDWLYVEQAEFVKAAAAALYGY